MEVDQFDRIENLSDEVYDKFEELHKKGVFADIESKLKEICSSLKEEYSISVNLAVEIFNPEKEKNITLLRRGIECSSGHETYLATSGSTSHRYVVNGHIVKLPHDYCPNCWGEWDFKLLHPTCPSCDYTMGKEVKLLLDTDVCPSCEKGKVSRSNPQCERCGIVLDSNMINWG